MPFCAETISSCRRQRKYKEENVFCVPTVVDTADYPVKEHVAAEPFVVGWIGGASTLRYLADISPLFISPPAARLFKVVADRPPEIAGAQLVFEKWSGEREKEMLLSFDVGIMPVRDDVWSRGKCGLKLIQYCASGLPSVSHPFGVSEQIIEDGESGFLRQDVDGWREAIERLRDDGALRKRMGRRARAIAEERYSLEVWGPRVAGMIEWPVMLSFGQEVLFRAHDGDRPARRRAMRACARSNPRTWRHTRLSAHSPPPRHERIWRSQPPDDGTGVILHDDAVLVKVVFPFHSFGRYPVRLSLHPPVVVGRIDVVYPEVVASDLPVRHPGIDCRPVPEGCPEAERAARGLPVALPFSARRRKAVPADVAFPAPIRPSISRYAFGA